MKSLFRKIITRILANQVKSLRKRHQFKIVGVVGGIGKTSTKLAIAQVVGKSLRVRYQDGNYNQSLSVPLVLFGHKIPNLLNPLAWLVIFYKNYRQIYGQYPYDLVVVELGTDRPGDIMEFANFLEIDYVVVTSIVPEHMENFADMKAVAEEELSVAKFSKKLIYNKDLVGEQYLSNIQLDKVSYSLHDETTGFRLSGLYKTSVGYEGDVKHGENIILHFTYDAVSEVQLYSVLAATVVSEELGLKHTKTIEGIASLMPVSGRMRRLKGIHDSLIIDDTYNASPEAVKSALSTLYGLDFEHRIAILGNMNELGSMSKDAHAEIGNLCDPSKLELVLTLGPDANNYLAPAAEAKGCQVVKFDSPYALGEYLAPKIQPNTVILAKGSQNKVFAEEAVKMLLSEPEDASKLVRQSSDWLKDKQRKFKNV